MPYTLTNTKICPFCHREILAVRKKCPYCHKVLVLTSLYPDPKRNKDIVEKLEKEHMTLQVVGDIYHVSRERIRQIYLKQVGHRYTALLQRRKEAQVQADAREWTTAIDFYCQNCQKPVYRHEKLHQRNFCKRCHTQIRKEQRITKLTNFCKQCGEKFHPFRTNPNSKYCSRTCYFARGKSKSKPPQKINGVISTIFRINNQVVYPKAP